MIGDKLLGEEGQVKAARCVAELFFGQLMQPRGRLIIAIAEESGSGESAIARTVSQALCEKGETVRLCDRMITLFTRQKQMPECAEKTSAGLARQRFT